jgi:predicted permease
MFRNALVIGIALGFAVNLGDIALPQPLTEGIDLVVRAALPAALFGMGGVLVRYRPEGDLKVIAWVCAVGLVLHPATTWAMGRLTGLERDGFRSAVLTAAMAPGINTYVFASIYGRARRVAASSVLIGTLVSILTVWLWLGALP